MAGLVRRVALIVALAPLSAWAWVGVVERPFDLGGSQVAFAARGDVVVVGRTDVSGDQGLLTVAQFSRSGRLRWQTTLADVLTTDPRSLAVGGRGGIYVAGAIGGDDEDTFGAFTVIKFEGGNGQEAWRWRPSEQEGLAEQVVVDDHGDAFVAGSYVRPVSEDRMGVVAKLRGADGTPLWSVELEAAHARAVGLLPDGDVVTIEHGEVHRRRGGDGQRLWTWDIRRVLHPQRVDIDGSGDVIVAGQDYLLKVDGDDGTFQWYASLPDFTAPLAGITDVALDGSGDVVVAGAVAGNGLTDFAVLKLAGADGTESWRYVEERDGRGRAVAVAVDARGDAVATGQLEGFPSGPYFEAVRLDGGTGRREWVLGRSENGAGADVAVDRAGHAAVSGFLSIRHPPAEPDADLVVVRLSRTGRGSTGPVRGRGPRDRK